MTYLPQGTRIKIKEGQPLAGLTGTIKGISTSGAPVIGVGYIIEPDDKSLIYSEMYPYDIFCAFDVMFEIEWDEKDNPTKPTRNKYFERILNAPIDERGYIDLREPTSEFRQKLFDGIKSVFYDPEYERTHWSVKVNMAVDEVLTHFQDIIPASQDPIYDDIDKGWNCCLARIKMSMEHTNE
jgi:hypothetical protein